jgi:hypothetical protein
MIRRWISDVPSKIVKILAIGGPVAAATADTTEIRFSGPFFTRLRRLIRRTWRRLAGRAGRERSASPVGTVHDFRDVLQVTAAHISVVPASRSSAGPSA